MAARSVVVNAIIAATLMGCSSNDLKFEDSKGLTCVIKGEWTASKGSLVDLVNRGPYVVRGERVDCDVHIENKVTRVVVEVIQSPVSKKLWIGPQQDFYLETDAGITGYKVGFLGHLLWCESMLTDEASKKNLKSLKAEFKKRVKPRDLMEAYGVENLRTSDVIEPESGTIVDRRLSPRQVLPHLYFPDGAHSGEARITSLSAEIDKVRIEIRNHIDADYQVHVAVWLDPKTRTLVKGDASDPANAARWETIDETRQLQAD